MTFDNRFISGKDSHGNKISFTPSGDSCLVTLRLANELRDRNLGNIIKLGVGKYIYIKSEKERYRFKKLDAWSIPEVVVKPLTNISIIRINTEVGSYGITKEKALEVGKYFDFQKSGFEKKIYIPVKFWEVE